MKRLVILIVLVIVVRFSGCKKEEITPIVT
jgi:hypothetical protein